MRVWRSRLLPLLARIEVSESSVEWAELRSPVKPLATLDEPLIFDRRQYLAALDDMDAALAATGTAPNHPPYTTPEL
ncbi:hypothetical protein SAMN05421595_2128 [Austwickia chelonae]|nr:hypothetical protein SAMN05421595_2128 [Austwickia chelonae]